MRIEKAAIGTFQRLALSRRLTVNQNLARRQNRLHHKLARGRMADLLTAIIGDKKTATFNVAPGLLVDDGGNAIDEKRKTINVDMGDIDSLSKNAPSFTSALVGHFLAEGLEIGKGNFNFLDDSRVRWGQANEMGSNEMGSGLHKLHYWTVYRCNHGKTVTYRD